MIGADALVRTLLAAKIDTVFANPGTSEMHMVSALDRNPGIRPVLALFEGVVTGAADGYARMAGKPAATLLHLGPGLANGVANLHNARKAGTPVINVVGDHAARHLQYDAPLTSDLDGIARAISHWVGRADGAANVAARTVEAIAASRGYPGRIATLLLPADAAWGEVSAEDPPAIPSMPAPLQDDAALEAAVTALRRHGAQAMLLLGGTALRGDGALQAVAIAQATGCRLSAQGANARIERGGDLPTLPRVPFQVDQAVDYLKDVRCLVRLGAPTPVAFFAYPDKPSLLIGTECDVVDAAPPGSDPQQVLQALAAALKAEHRNLRLEAPVAVVPPHGALNHGSIAAAIAATLPEHTIVVDEAITTGRQIYPVTAAAPRHDWLNNMGGSIGYGLPVALGAAVACPERPVLAMVGDGSAFYTEQALWSMAREQANVTVVIFANRSYAILRNEWQKIGAGEAGPRARDMLTLDRPDPDWVAIALGHGMPGERVATAEDLVRALRQRFSAQGPGLIEVML